LIGLVKIAHFEHDFVSRVQVALECSEKHSK